MTIGGTDDKQLLSWANNKVKSCQIKSLNDKSLKNSLFLFELLGNIVKGSYDENEVYSEENEESYINNAQYFLSCARKCGAVIFLVHEDILEVIVNEVYIGSFENDDRVVCRAEQTGQTWTKSIHQGHYWQENGCLIHHIYITLIY